MEEHHEQRQAKKDLGNAEREAGNQAHTLCQTSPSWEVKDRTLLSLYPELSSAGSTFCTLGLVLIRCTEDLTVNLRKIKVHLKPEKRKENSLFKDSTKDPWKLFSPLLACIDL